jgi:hydroxymethylglutaryl-CoA reductase (NADPH)
VTVSGSCVSADERDGELLELVPRLSGQGYAPEQVGQRRAWVEQRTGARLRHVGSSSLPSETLRGNVENPVGAAQVPLGVAGPLLVNGLHARGTFYVPLATTEGALVRSYERGMMTLSRAGGARARVYLDENRASPVFGFPDVEAAHDFASRLSDDLSALRAAAESTTRHGKLLRVECCPVGRRVIVHFCYHTADAHGMNMIVKATDAACRWIVEHYDIERHYILSGLCSEKRASGALFAGGKGKKVVAGALLPAAVVRAYLHATTADLCDLWHATMLGHVHAHAVGYNAHYANGLTALFIACGQDVANVVNSATGITEFEQTGEGDLYASVTLPSLSVATVGGGTGLGTSRECLAMLGCAGAGKAPKLAEIAAATLLAGELSMAAAIASGEFVAAHETYGRNRPEGRS